MLDFLHLHALWLIMDPWLPHPWPRDRQRWPHIDQHNQKTIDAIVDYLPRLRHVAVSVSMKYSVHPALHHLPNTQNRLEHLDAMMQQHRITDLVYTGFHWGICMLNKPDGAVNVKQHTGYTLYAFRPLCATMPGTQARGLDDKMAAHVMIL